MLHSFIVTAAETDMASLGRRNGSLPEQEIGEM